MSEILDVVEAKNVQARREAEAFQQAADRAVESAKVLSDVIKSRKRRKVANALIIRAVIAVALVAAFWLADGVDLMAVELAVPLECAVMVWFSVYFGAWLQFIFGKEGLLK